MLPLIPGRVSTPCRVVGSPESVVLSPVVAQSEQSPDGPNTQCSRHRHMFGCKTHQGTSKSVTCDMCKSQPSVTIRIILKKS